MCAVSIYQKPCYPHMKQKLFFASPAFDDEVLLYLHVSKHYFNFRGASSCYHTLGNPTYML
jgi:hypothetical protein